MEIKLNNVTKEYKGIKALDNIDLTIKTPAMIGFLGPNGAGKSTLMKILVGQLMPSYGDVTVDGKNLSQNLNYLKTRLGYLPQDFGLYDELTVEQFLDYISCLKGISENRKKVILNCIKNTNLLEKRKAKIKTLSGGQKQRVGIAQALLNDPELIIVDEPTVGLDPEERIKYRNLFSQGASNKIVILSTHIVEDIESICNQLIVLNKGKFLFNGLPSELIKKAANHVGIVEISNEQKEEFLKREKQESFKVTSTIVKPTGIHYKIVANVLPDFCEKVTPTLEDAYVYCMLKEEQLSD
ncbi:ABC transporter ATP-binding protein [Clostridium gelidum]|uniref:ABC transporter ATP-binding protein n=1 Tax=Clostridium gelidum TaxID=704125 RepID=A0ABN6IXD4_9CLOT|nr:ABC transporter ATP-binding protein [Clostridium gelidum]BCZ46800.1 ABC transporter ATP-binding protein [Clostridium gelidum]